jgi:phospholipase C
MADPIQHVVVLMLENRSFDQMLGCMKSINPGVDGIDPAHPFCNPDFPATNPPVCQAVCTVRTNANDPRHDLDNVLQQIAGPCQGFVADYAQNFPQSGAAARAEVMGFYPHGFLPALHALADNFTICDRWFSSMPGPTWPNRFFVHSGTCLGHVKMPNGIWQPNLHIYDQTTIYDRLEEQGITWNIYYGDIPHTMLMVHQWQYPDHYHHTSEFFEDAQGSEEDFPQYSFIEPNYMNRTGEQNDQHPPTDILKGDVLLARIYNALRANQALWEKTLLVVLYDEHGGFADHVEPPPAVPPDNNVQEYAFNQLGVRVPALLVSPWVARTAVHTVFDHTSLLKYLIEKWRLGSLLQRTAAAQSFGDAIQDTLRSDTPATVPVSQIAPAPAAAMPAAAQELNENQAALLAFSQFLETKLSQVDSPADIGRRSLASVGSMADQVAAATERVDKFLQYRGKGLL